MHMLKEPFESSHFSTHRNKSQLMEASAESVTIESDESDIELDDRLSTTSSRSKDGRFLKTGSKTVHPCPYSDCIKYFSRPSRLQTHLLSHSGEQPFKCTNTGCTKAYSRSAHLKRHLQKCAKNDNIPKTDITDEKNDEVFKCQICPKTFSNKYSLQKHAKVHEDSQRYVCLQCNKSFHKHHFLKSHIALEHEKEGNNGKVTCPKCDKKFAYESQMKRHFSRHHANLKTYECSICNQVFNKWTDLRAHNSLKHPKPGKNSCEVCHKEFSGRSASGNLQKHRLTHSANRKVFHCPIMPCPRFYFFEKNLEDHISGYHEGKRFPCMEKNCKARFSSRRKLVLHIKSVHSDEPKNPKQVKTGTERATRVDKGTFKTSMASILSDVSAEQVSKNSSSKQQGDLTPTRCDKDLEKGVNLENTSTLENENIMKTFLKEKKKVDKKRKSKRTNSLFTGGETIPIFKLPIYKKTKNVTSLVKKDEILIRPSKIGQSVDSSENRTVQHFLSYSESEFAETSNKGDPKETLTCKNNKTIDFSKYMVISTSNYKK